jgi:hypothetical protein
MCSEYGLVNKFSAVQRQFFPDTTKKIIFLGHFLEDEVEVFGKIMFVVDLYAKILYYPSSFELLMIDHSTYMYQL